MTKITAGPAHASRFTITEPFAGDPALVARVEALLADLSADNADLLRAFHRIQHEFGYVAEETIPILATKFRTTPAMLFGALDFYSEIRTVPPAETEVQWCSGPACLLKGSLNIRRVLESILGCGMNSTTEDGKYGLQLVQCDGTCHLAPLLRLEGRYLGPLSVSDAITLARELKGELAPEPQAAAEPADAGETKDGE
jgi:NADH:ubiquinone oxidoreductase subunit E